MTVAGGTRWSFLYYGDTLVGFKLGNDTYYYLRNLQGDIVQIVDANGAVVVSYRYDDWGKVVGITGSAAATVGIQNPFRYRGYFYDNESGLYYLNSRYYDPETGRFVSADNCLLLFSAQGIIGYNLFAYCGNDPINHVDPNGNEWWHWAIAGCVVIALVAASIVTCGGAAVAAATAAAVVTGTCAVGVSTTAVVVTGAAVGAAIGFGATAVYAAANSSTEDEFMSYGDEAMLLTAVGGALGTVAGALNGIVACFVAGTLVHTDKGLCPIEQIKTGDFVWSWNEETGQTELKRVSECYQRQTTELVHLCLNGEEIVTTPTHPFYVPVRGWTESVKLRAGDLLQTLNGELVVVEWVQHEILEEPVWVYNFQVEEDHCYYVSGTGVLVHNKCVVNENGVRVEVRTSNEHGMPHAHISGRGRDTTIGLNGSPMKGHPSFTRVQSQVIFKYWEEIQDAIIKYFRQTH